MVDPSHNVSKFQYILFISRNIKFVWWLGMHHSDNQTVWSQILPLIILTNFKYNMRLCYAVVQFYVNSCSFVFRLSVVMPRPTGSVMLYRNTVNCAAWHLAVNRHEDWARDTATHRPSADPVKPPGSERTRSSCVESDKHNILLYFLLYPVIVSSLCCAFWNKWHMLCWQWPNYKYLCLFTYW